MYFDFSELLNWNYYTHISPQGDFLWGFPLLVFFFVLIFIRPIVSAIAPQDKYFKKAIKRKLGKFIGLGVLGVLAVLSRFALIPLFSMRLWLFGILLLSIISLSWTTFSVWKNYEERLHSVRREHRKKR